QALTAVALGRARAAVADAPLVLDYAAGHAGLRVAGGVGAAVPRVVVVSKDAPDLASFVSAALHELDRDGGLARLRERWHL
ncbi:MAG TPA: transporter substrate-binding domain-containing protein, partial [bacterium]|nr:transporter substrate-binding domain-containing protein [bacterium]